LSNSHGSIIITYMDAGEGIYNFSAVLNYENSVFEDITADNISTESSSGWQKTYSSDTKKLLLDNASYIKDDQTIATITLKAKSEVQVTSSTFGLTEVKAANMEGEIQGKDISTVIQIGEGGGQIPVTNEVPVINETGDNTIIGSNTIQNSNTVPTVIDPVNEVTTSMGTGSSSGKKTYTYKGFNVLGSINIPKTGINYPIIDTASKKGIETSVAYFYGPGPNQVGNTTIVGHNYRNGSFFGKNKRLANGDIIYITDNSGAKIKYTIYNIYTTTPDDGTYLTRDTNGKREVSLSTCTDDSKGRLVIWAREG